MTEATTLLAAGTQPTDAPATQTAAVETTTPVVVDTPAATDATTTADATKPEGGGKPTEQTGAPEAYEFKTPEGTPLSEAGIAAFSTFAKGQNLSQEAAQSLMDTLAPAMAASQAEQIAAIQAGWAEAAQTDKEFGGAKLAENLAVAQNAIEKFGTPELKTFLDQSGLGNHPELIRAFHKVGKAISEDTVVTGRQGQSSVGQPSAAQRMYPNMNP